MTFITIPKRVDAETKIYRIVPDKNRGNGSFWFIHSDITNLTRKKWRSDYAILRMYNPGTETPTQGEAYYLYEYNTTPEDIGWIGAAAGQQVSYHSTCILEGGGKQVYFLQLKNMPKKIDLPSKF